MLPGLDSTKEELGSTEQTFLDRGLATVTLDGPGQGEAEYDLPLRGDWAPVAEAVWEAIGTQPDLDRAGSRCGASASAATTRRARGASATGSEPASRWGSLQLR